MAFNLAYKYRAKNFANRIVTGVVHAPNKAVGYAKLSKNGLQPIELALQVTESVKGILVSEFDQKELVRFYATLGRRVNNGKSMVDGLEAATEFIRDNKLKMAALTMRQRILEGQSIHEAMESAGFPKRDATAMRSTSAGSGIGDQLIAISHEISRVNGLRQAIKSIFRMPIIMSFVMYIFLFLAITKAAPMTLKFLKQTQLKLSLSTFNKMYFEFSTFFNENYFLATLVYWSIPVLLFMFFRSRYARLISNKIPIVNNISMKADQAALWTSFGILYSANAPIKEACRIVASAAKREDSQKAFNELGALISTGYSIGDATMKASFPEEIRRGVLSANSSGKLVDGLNDMARNLEEDVQVLTTLLQENMNLLAYAVMAVGLMFLFFVTYYPIVASVLSNI